MMTAPEDTHEAPRRRIVPRQVPLVVAGIFGIGLLGARLPEALSPEGQWDFRTYYYAVKVYDAGGNPWDRDELVRAAGGMVHPFLYPPHTLVFLRLFALDDLPTARSAYLLAKLACLVVLLVLWTTYFVRAGARGWFLAFAALGYHLALGRDLVSGNVSLFEQTLIWFGLFALIRGRLWLFCLLIILAAQFKLQPLFLLGLVLLTDSRHRWRCLGVSAVACALLAVGVYLSDPLGAQTFWHLAAQVAPAERGGIYNQCALPLIREVTDEMMRRFSLFDDVSYRTVAYLPYGVYVFAVLFVFVRWVRGGRDFRSAVFLGLLTYALIAPRMKDYSYTLLLVPTFELIRFRLGRGGFIEWLVVPLVALLAFPAPDVLWRYRALLLAGWTWAVAVKVNATGHTVFGPSSLRPDFSPAFVIDNGENPSGRPRDA
jgi:hypothetical protein